MPKVRKLTFKEKRFAKKYVENGGNGTQAALQVYNVNNAVTADAVARETLGRPRVQEAIEEIANKEGVTHATILQKFNQISSKEAEKWSGDAILKANIELAKILQMYPGSKHTNLNVSLKGRLTGMKFQDAKKALEKLRTDNDELVTEVDRINPEAD